MQSSAFQDMPIPQDDEAVNVFWNRLTLTQKSTLCPNRTVQYLQQDFVYLCNSDKTSVYNYCAHYQG